MSVSEKKTAHSDYDVEAALSGGTALSRQISVNLTAEQFERLYLQPGGDRAKNSLASTLGNPTPLGVASFVVSLTCFAIDLCGISGVTTAAVVSQVAAFYYFTAVGMILSGIFELIIGNTFPATVFITYGGFWASAGFLFQPTQGIAATLGAGSVDYNHGIAIYLAAICGLNLLYLITSLRTNVVFVLLFSVLEVSEILLVVAYTNIGNGVLGNILNILKAAGAFAFITSLLGWYLLAVLLFGSTGIPIALPVGDLSGFLSPKKSE